MRTLVVQYENMNYLLNLAFIYIGLRRIVVFHSRVASIFKTQIADFFPEILVLFFSENYVVLQP